MCSALGIMISESTSTMKLLKLEKLCDLMN